MSQRFKRFTSLAAILLVLSMMLTITFRAVARANGDDARQATGSSIEVTGLPKQGVVDDSQDVGDAAEDRQDNVEREFNETDEFDDEEEEEEDWDEDEPRDSDEPGEDKDEEDQGEEDDHFEDDHFEEDYLEEDYLEEYDLEEYDLDDVETELGTAEFALEIKQLAGSKSATFVYALVQLADYVELEQMIPTLEEIEQSTTDEGIQRVVRLYLAVAYAESDDAQRAMQVLRSLSQ